MIIDTHSHHDHSSYHSDLDSIFDRAFAAGVQKFIIPAADPKDIAKAQAIALAQENVFYAVGTHPYHAEEHSDEAILPLIDNPKCVAIGECGLDYFRLPKDTAEAEAIIRLQKTVFKRQIEIANERSLPLIVHIRDASDDALEMLINLSKTGGVLHCFNADEQLLKLIDRGFYYGIGGVLTFANAQKLQEIVTRIPRDRILLETDAPYLTPMPHRGKRNEPAYTAIVAAKLAEILSIPIETICEITTQNAMRCFGRMNNYDR
ncbi:TatD family hydrolase [Campylobacterota bacterium]|nr:TatD family hydrolase [Campylobacterota bacterium]